MLPDEVARFDTTDEEYPLMIDMKNSQIRRTDYGFAYGFGSW